MNKILYLLFIFCLSCQQEQEDILPYPARYTERILIAYLVGDNNLSSEIDLKIKAIEEGMQTIDPLSGKAIVFADYWDRPPQIMEISADGSKCIETLAETNSAIPVNLQSVLRRIVTGYPAESYGLICFSHASGWLPQGALSDPLHFSETRSKTVFEDRGTEMTLTGFSEAIDVLPGKQRYEFIIFETCFMAGIEVAYELKDKTGYLVASAAEMLSDGMAGIYPSGMPLLFRPVAELGAFAQHYFDHWHSKTGAYQSATISVINTSCLQELANHIRDIHFKDESYPEQPPIDTFQSFNRHPYHLFFDLEEIVSYHTDEEMKSQLRKILGKVVEYKASTPAFMIGYPHSFTISKHCGITTYMKQPAFGKLNELYENTSWQKACRK